MNGYPAWAEISRSKLLYNFQLLRSAASPAELLAVVKANAYGHGTVECSQDLMADGARWLGVTNLDEGIAVRAACPEAEILAMCGLWPGEADAIIAHRITPVVWESVHLYEAARPGKPIAIHLEIDTGMSRQGVRLAGLPSLLDKLETLPTLRLDGVLTHFHSPEMLDSQTNEEQFAQFVTAIDAIFAR
jgi:alanine racemase